MLYKNFIRPLLFRFDPESAHRLAVAFLSQPVFRFPLNLMTYFEHPVLRKEIFGLTFSNPVGLAAGFDKNAACVDGFAALGFGFIEIGTVTPKPQPGNPKPRLFRLIRDRALINRMGFNNDGVNAVARNLAKRKSSVIVGGNIGKNKITPNTDAIDDYVVCFKTLFDLVDYFVVNVSSPNTPGLRDLQEKEPLHRILMTLQDINSGYTRRKPLLLKIAPDLTDDQLQNIIETVDETKLDGLVLTNTTISRVGLNTRPDRIRKIGDGGLSGAAVFTQSTEILLKVRRTNESIPIIGVGGIFSAEDARRKLDAGADLLQVYTGLIYEGPLIVRKLKKNLSIL